MHRKISHLSPARRLFCSLFLFLILLASGSIVHAGTAEPALVKDIRSGPAGSSPSALKGAHGVLYFNANDGVAGSEFWKSDGTEAGTVLVKDIRPGADSSGAQFFFPVGELIYFRANDGTSGPELWKSDGTTAGTQMVKDINTEEFFGSFPTPLAALGNVLFFAARDNSFLNPTDGFGNELWRSDGTTAGTTMVKDIRPGLESSDPGGAVRIGSTIYFWANDGVHGRELWKSDGTPAGTVLVKDINPGAGDSLKSVIHVLNNALYFAADDGTHGVELWRSDGTEAGTAMVKEIRPGAGDTAITQMTVAGNRLFFWASDGVHGIEIWTSDGTASGTVMSGDLTIGAGSPLTPMGESVYFWSNAVPSQAVPTGGSPLALWTSDGSAAGTRMVKAVNPGGMGIPSAELMAAGKMLYFWVATGANKHLWQSDGTEEGTLALETTFVGGGDGEQSWLTPVGSKLFFAAMAEGGEDRELWALEITPVEEPSQPPVYVPFVFGR